MRLREEHADFLRDFRGDTIHPSTLEIMHELGLLDDFLALPHQQTVVVRAQVGDRSFEFADFSRLPTRCRFMAFMPQWNFLDFLAERARRFPSFRLEMSCEVTGVVEASGRVAGVRLRGGGGEREEEADLVVAADGRRSDVRAAAGMQVEELGAPMDVLWFRLPQTPHGPVETMGRFDPGRIFIAINRGDYWQCGYVIAKGAFERIRQRGLEAFRASVAEAAPYAADRVAAIGSWDDVHLLTVQVDRLRQWYRSGLLCIGDAAHAMSPVGGIGINLAIQDAVAAANLLARPLLEGNVSVDDLRRVQERRLFPTRATQWAQIQIQSRIIAPVLGTTGPLSPPLPLRLIGRFPVLRRVTARLVGLGARPEHVRIPAAGQVSRLVG